MDKEKDLTFTPKDPDLTRTSEDAGPTTRMTEDYVQFLHDTYGEDGEEADLDDFTDPDDIDDLSRMDGADELTADEEEGDVLRGFAAEEDDGEEIPYADAPYFADPTDNTQEMDADTSSWDS